MQVAISTNRFKILAAVLAVTLLFSSAGIFLDFHICQGKIKSVGVFSEAPDCGMINGESSCDSYADKPLGYPVVSNMPCCQNHALLSIQKVENSDLEVSTISPVALLAVPKIEIQKAIAPESTINLIRIDEGPPDVQLHKLFETYLI